ncbi:MAG: hypothetical protein Q9162_007360 [Coniocarpon cinnabarinum]
MPSSSHLRNQAAFAPFEAPVTHSIHPSRLAPPEKKRKMTITQTYFLAHTARGKLSHEAARGDHDLRLLVGHANLLDSLTVELQEAEREQDAWFEKTVAESRKPAEPKRVQFKDDVAKVAAADEAEMSDDSDADSEDSDDEDIYAQPTVPEVPAQLVHSLRTRSKSPPPLPAVEEEEDEDEDYYDDVDMDNEELALQRVPSHSASPPELVHDSDDSDDDMSGPDSPPATDASSPASFVLPQDVKTKDFAAAVPKCKIQRLEDTPMMQAVY